MILFLPLFFIALYAKIELKVDKAVRTIEHYIEESIILHGTNSSPSTLKKFRFSLPKERLSKLRILRITESNSNFTSSTFDSNEFTYNLLRAKPSGETFTLKLIMYFSDRFEFRPYKIKFNEDQLVDFEDEVFALKFDEEFEIASLSLKYIFPSYNLKKDLNPDLTEKTLGQSYEYVNTNEKRPFDRKYSFYFTMNKPFDVFERAERFVEVSLWGNIREVNNLYLKNEAAALDGEYSTIDYSPQNLQSGKNSLRWLTAKLNGGIHGLSIMDEVGNVTRPMARRVKDDIELILVPRFSLFGGWKSSFFIEFSQDSSDFLFQAKNDPDLFKFDFRFGHLFDMVLAKKYVLNVCLPQGSTLVSADLKYYFTSNSTFFQKSLLDSEGKTCHQYTFDNVMPMIFNQNFEVQFKVSGSNVWEKLIYLIWLCFAGNLIVFLLARVDFSFDSRDKAEKVKTE